MFIRYRNLQPVGIRHCANADDMILLSNTEKNMQGLINLWNNQLVKYNIEVNVSNTKVVVIEGEIKQVNINIEKG